MVLIIAGGIASAFAAVCVISEGFYYNYFLKSYAQVQMKYKGPAVQNTVYLRNSSKAQDYVKELFEENYKQAVKNLEDTYPLLLKGKVPTWDTIKGKIGTTKESGGKTYVLNYPDFMNIGYGCGVPDLFDTICFSMGQENPLSSNSIMYATYNGLTAAVASFLFKTDTKIKEKRYACWAKDRNEYKCQQLVKDKADRDFYYINTYDDLWKLEQYMPVDGKYKTKSQADEAKYVFNEYIILPIAIHQMTKDDVDVQIKRFAEGKEDAFMFESDTKHFRVEAKKYVEDHAKNAQKEQDDKTQDENFYWCKSEPNGWDDAFKGLDQKCPTQISNPTKIPQDKDNLQGAFDMTNIGLYPDFATSYLKSKARKDKFSAGETNYIQIAIGAMVCQLLGIVFWAFGKFASKGTD